MFALSFLHFEERRNPRMKTAVCRLTLGRTRVSGYLLDRFIAPMILDLNTNGIQTMASCSGLQAEHPENRFKPESGYLAIRYSEELLKYLVDNLVDPIIEVKQSECYLKPSILVIIQSNNDNVLKEKWKLIWNILKKRCNGT